MSQKSGRSGSKETDVKLKDLLDVPDEFKL